jgi:hypothetical protein
MSCNAPICLQLIFFQKIDIFRFSLKKVISFVQAYEPKLMDLADFTKFHRNSFDGLALQHLPVYVFIFVLFMQNITSITTNCIQRPLLFISSALVR